MSTYEIRVTGKDQSAGCVDNFAALLKTLKAGNREEYGSMLVTYDEAVKIVGRPGLTRFIHVRQQAPSIEKPDYGYTASASVKVDRRPALEFLRSAYAHHKDRAMVEMSLHGSCLFIG